MKKPKQILKLLDILCVEWGFCLSSKDKERISNQSNLDAEEFSREVLEAEGMDPEQEKEWYIKIKERYTEFCINER